jgi:hypothetical protein
VDETVPEDEAPPRRPRARECHDQADGATGRVARGVERARRVSAATVDGALPLATIRVLFLSITVIKGGHRVRREGGSLIVRRSYLLIQNGSYVENEARFIFDCSETESYG